MSFDRHIEDEIDANRKCGSAICKLYHGKQVIAVEEALSKLGMLKYGFSFCREASKDDAIEILFQSLRFHLASDGYVVMDETIAKTISQQFINALPATAKLYVNEIWGGNEPLTQSCYDQGIIAIDNGMVGILWIMDDAL